VFFTGIMEGDACKTISENDKFILNKFKLPIEGCSQVIDDALGRGLA